MEFKRYPVGVQSFDKIIEGNYIYIDKTDLVHSLVNRGAPIFLSRPRRFGKSLLLSTIDKTYSTLCGITPQEIRDNLHHAIEQLAENNGMTTEEANAKLKANYDGYHFASDLRDVYNPFSLMRVFKSMQFGNYWFQSDNPRFLAEKLLNDKINLYSLHKSMESGTQLQDLDLASTNPIPLMYQSGYLTIKAYDSRFDRYTLGYPNREVEESFLGSLAPLYTLKKEGIDTFDFSPSLRRIDDIKIEREA